MTKELVYKNGLLEQNGSWKLPPKLAPEVYYKHIELYEGYILFESVAVHSPDVSVLANQPVVGPYMYGPPRIYLSEFTSCREFFAQYALELIGRTLTLKSVRNDLDCQMITYVYFQSSKPALKYILSCLKHTFRQMERSLGIARPLDVEILPYHLDGGDKCYILTLRFPLEWGSKTTWIKSVARLSLLGLIVRMTIAYYRNHYDDRKNGKQLPKKLNFIDIFRNIQSYSTEEIEPLTLKGLEDFPFSVQKKDMFLVWKELRSLFKEGMDLHPTLNNPHKCTGVMQALKKARRIRKADKTRRDKKQRSTHE